MQLLQCWKCLEVITLKLLYFKIKYILFTCELTYQGGQSLPENTMDKKEVGVYGYQLK